MKFKRRLAALILILAMLLSPMGAISEGAALTLPSQLVIIDEEAFYGSTAIQKVILPEGIHEIRARAFADCAIEEISLPSTLEFIAEDAFEGSALKTVIADQGTYAFDWAVKQGYLKYPLGVTVKSRTEGIPEVGDTLKWLAEGTGGKQPLVYAFKLYRDDVLVSDIPGGAGANYEYLAGAAGEYVLHVEVTDADGDVADVDSVPVTVTGPMVLTLSASAERVEPGNTVTWTAAVSGGTEPFQYSFQIYSGDEQEPIQSIMGSAPRFTFHLEEEGKYRVEASATDADGKTARAESGAVVVSSRLFASLEADAARVRTGSAVTWTAQTLNGNGTFRYTYELYDANGALVDRAENVEQDTYTHTFDTPGEYHVKVTVTSGEETAEAESASVVVSQKMTLSVSADAETVKPGTLVTWTAEAQNGVAPIRYCFELYDAEGEQIRDCDETTANTFTCDLGPGEYHARVVATDAEGDTASAESGTVTVLPAFSVELAGGARWAYPGDTVVWTAEAQNGTEPYRYQFQLYKGEEMIQTTGMGSTKRYSYTFDDLGNYLIHLDVTDADGRDAQTGSSEYLTVVTPISLSVTGDRDSVSPSGTVTWTVNGTGGAGDYTFELYRGETPVEGETPFSTVTQKNEFTFETVGAERVRVVMKDLGGMEISECTPPVSIESGLSLSFIDSPITARLGDTANWTVQAEQGAEPIQYAFILKRAVDGGDEQLVDSTEYSDSASYSRALTEAGTYTLTAMAKDAAGETAEAVNGPLRVKDDLTFSIRASARRARPGDTVNWTVTGEGGRTPYQYAFRVYRDGELIQSTESGKSRSFSYTPDEPGNYRVLVKMTDADGDAFEAPGETLVVSSVLAVEISADAQSARTGDTVTWTAQGMNGVEPYRYAFSLLDAEGTVLDATEPGEADVYTHVFEAAGEYTVRVTATDANNETATDQSAALTVAAAPHLVFTDGARSVQTGGTAAWSVEGTDGVEPCLYAFQVMCDGEIVYETEFGESKRFEYTFEEPGEYIVQCMMRDAAGITVQALSDPLYVGSITLTVTASAQGALTDDTVTWTAEGAGGTEPYQYGFKLYRGGELADTAAPSESGIYSFTFVKAGNYYVLAQLIDEAGQVVEARSDMLSVLLADLEVLDIDNPASELSIIRAYTWTAQAKGGEKPYEYRFVLSSGEETLYTREFSQKQTFSYTFFDAGTYTLAVEVRDSLGTQTDAYVESFNVANSNVTIKGIVRIYVPINPSTGNVDDSKTGHYELQINNTNGTEFAFGDRVYHNPVFSFHSTSGEGSLGIVSMFDGDRVLMHNTKLYTWSFDSTPAKLKEFMITNMEKLYLDTENRVETEEQVDYNIKTGPFRYYVINESNCFTAVATWASWMGSDRLKQEITGNYKDYIAPAMFHKLGKYWTYVGELGSA